MVLLIHELAARRNQPATSACAHRRDSRGSLLVGRRKDFGQVRDELPVPKLSNQARSILISKKPRGPAGRPWWRHGERTNRRADSNCLQLRRGLTAEKAPVAAYVSLSRWKLQASCLR
jgi:hypothetical protein